MVVAVGVGVPIVSPWLLCSESGEEVKGEEEWAEPSTVEEPDVGGAVTVDEDPEEDKEVDLDIGASAVAAGLAGTSGASVSAGLSGALDSWLESATEAAGVLTDPSGRTAVPENKTRN